MENIQDDKAYISYLENQLLIAKSMLIEEKAINLILQETAKAVWDNGLGNFGRN